MRILLRNAMLVGGVLAGLGYSLPSYAVGASIGPVPVGPSAVSFGGSGGLPHHIPTPILPKGTVDGDGSGTPPGHRDPTPGDPGGTVSIDGSGTPIHALPPGKGCGGIADCIGVITPPPPPPVHALPPGKGCGGIADCVG